MFAEVVACSRKRKEPFSICSLYFFAIAFSSSAAPADNFFDANNSELRVFKPIALFAFGATFFATIFFATAFFAVSVISGLAFLVEPFLGPGFCLTLGEVAAATFFAGAPECAFGATFLEGDCDFFFGVCLFVLMGKNYQIVSSPAGTISRLLFILWNFIQTQCPKLPLL